MRKRKGRKQHSHHRHGTYSRSIFAPWGSNILKGSYQAIRFGVSTANTWAHAVRRQIDGVTGGVTWTAFFIDFLTVLYKAIWPTNIFLGALLCIFVQFDLVQIVDQPSFGEGATLRLALGHDPCQRWSNLPRLSATGALGRTPDFDFRRPPETRQPSPSHSSSSCILHYYSVHGTIPRLLRSSILPPLLVIFVLA